MSEINEFFQGIARQLRQSEDERSERERSQRESQGFTGEVWDSLVGRWRALYAPPITDFKEVGRIASQVADRFGDDALSAFSVQVGHSERKLVKALDNFREAHLDSQSPLPKIFPAETDYVEDLQVRLVNKGWVAKREETMGFGRVDIVASLQERGRRRAPQLIEAKLSSDWRAAAQALGQLLFYYGCLAGTRDITDYGLWFASPDAPDEDVLKVLARHGVRHIA